MTYAKGFDKDPDADLDYSIDWSAWLGTDTISSSSWTVPAGLTAGATSELNGVTTIWLSGGTDRTNYLVTNRITTAAGRVDDRSIQIRVAER